MLDTFTIVVPVVLIFVTAFVLLLIAFVIVGVMVVLVLATINAISVVLTMVVVVLPIRSHIDDPHTSVLLTLSPNPDEHRDEQAMYMLVSPGQQEPPKKCNIERAGQYQTRTMMGTVSRAPL